MSLYTLTITLTSLVLVVMMRSLVVEEVEESLTKGRDAKACSHSHQELPLPKISPRCGQWIYLPKKGDLLKRATRRKIICTSIAVVQFWRGH